MSLRSRLRDMVSGLPEGASVTLPVAEIRELLDEEPESEREDRLGQVEVAADAPEGPSELVESELSWAAKLWSVPPETRMDAEQAAEATGRSKSRIYKLTSADEIPHRKAAGSLVFVAGELRTWLRERETVEVKGRMELEDETEYLRRTS